MKKLNVLDTRGKRKKKKTKRKTKQTRTVLVDHDLHVIVFTTGQVPSVQWRASIDRNKGCTMSFLNTLIYRAEFIILAIYLSSPSSPITYSSSGRLTWFVRARCRLCTRLSEQKDIEFTLCYFVLRRPQYFGRDRLRLPSELVIVLYGDSQGVCLFPKMTRMDCQADGAFELQALGNAKRAVSERVVLSANVDITGKGSPVLGLGKNVRGTSRPRIICNISKLGNRAKAFPASRLFLFLYNARFVLSDRRSACCFANC